MHPPCIHLQNDIKKNSRFQSHNGILCIRYPLNPRTLIKIRKGSREGYWFGRTLAFTLTIGPVGSKTTVSPPRRLDIGSAHDNSSISNDNTSGNDAEDMNISGSRGVLFKSLPLTPPCSVVSKVIKKKKNEENLCVPRNSIEENKALDDVISRTTHKCDAR